MALQLDDPRQAAVRRALDRVAEGRQVGEVESQRLECKQDASRLDDRGELRAGDPRHGPTAKVLADALACLANAEGGAVIVGVDDAAAGSDALVGTDLDEPWTRERIYQLTGGPSGGIRPQTIVHHEDGVRLLILLCDPSPHPVPDHNHAYRRREGRSCVPIPPRELTTFALRRGGEDPTASSTSAVEEDVHPAALEVARDYLRATGEEERSRLADSDDRTLVRALGLLASDGRLNLAGKLLVTRHPTASPLLDLLVREAPGAATVDRFESRELSLLEQFREVERTLTAHNPQEEVPSASFARGQVRRIPAGAAREAIVNAVMHRDWRYDQPITVELSGDTLVATSPGGFLPQVNAENVLTAPSVTRNPRLAQAMRSLRLAEREGSGVDRMYRDMIVLGHDPPEIVEWADGTAVRCVLVGGPPTPEVVDLWARLEPGAAVDVDLAVILHVLRRQPAINVSETAEAIQKTPREAKDALLRAREAGLVQTTTRQGTFRLSDAGRATLRPLLGYLRTSEDEAARVIAAHLRQHGEIRAADVIDLFDVSQTQASRILRREVEAGRIRIPEGAPTMGRNVHYEAADQRGSGSP